MALHPEHLKPVFDCPNEKCKKQSERLIATSKGLGCEHCMSSELKKYCGGIIVRGENKHSPKMTYADKMHIKTNRKRADGQYRPDPRWA